MHRQDINEAAPPVPAERDLGRDEVTGTAQPPRDRPDDAGMRAVMDGRRLGIVVGSVYRAVTCGARCRLAASEPAAAVHGSGSTR
jgi:hypothetical protein